MSPKKTSLPDRRRALRQKILLGLAAAGTAYVAPILVPINEAMAASNPTGEGNTPESVSRQTRNRYASRPSRGSRGRRDSRYSRGSRGSRGSRYSRGSRNSRGSRYSRGSRSYRGSRPFRGR